MYFLKVTLYDGRPCLINLRVINSVCAAAVLASGAKSVIEVDGGTRGQAAFYDLRETVDEIAAQMNALCEGSVNTTPDMRPEP